MAVNPHRLGVFPHDPRPRSVGFAAIFACLLASVAARLHHRESACSRSSSPEFSSIQRPCSVTSMLADASPLIQRRRAMVPSPRLQAAQFRRVFMLCILTFACRLRPRHVSRARGDSSATALEAHLQRVPSIARDPPRCISSGDTADGTRRGYRRTSSADPLSRRFRPRCRPSGRKGRAGTPTAPSPAP